MDYVEFTSTTTTPGMQLSTTNSTTAVTILTAPGAASTQRKVNGLTVVNEDTVNIAVTIRINDNSTLYPITDSLVIPPGSTLQFTDTRGWFMIDSKGRMQQSLASPPSNVQVFTINGTWTKPNGVTEIFVSVTGGGGGGRGGA